MTVADDHILVYSENGAARFSSLADVSDSLPPHTSSVQSSLGCFLGMSSEDSYHYQYGSPVYIKQAHVRNARIHQDLVAHLEDS